MRLGIREHELTKHISREIDKTRENSSMALFVLYEIVHNKGKKEVSVCT